MKKKAIRVGIIFVIVIVVCIFISRTVVSLTTPKAEFIGSRTASVVNTYYIDGQFEYANEVSVFWTEAADYAVEITEVNIRIGKKVKEGDVLVSAIVSSGYYDDINSLENQLASLLVSKVQYVDILSDGKINLDGIEAVATRDYLAKEREVSIMRARMIAILKTNDLIDDETEIVSENRILTLWENIDDAEMLAEYEELNIQLEEVLEVLSKQLNKGNNREFSMTLGWDALIISIAEIENKLSDMYTLLENLTEYKSPIAGVITSVNIEEGQVYNGYNALCRIDSTKALSIVVPLMGLSSKAINSDNSYTFTNNGVVYRCDLGGRFTDEFTGKKYLLLAPEDKFWKSISNANSLLNKSVAIESGNNLGSFETIPTSALLGSKDKYYVYVATPAKGFWGDEYHVIRHEVEVEALSDLTAGITGSFLGMVGLETYILDNWDKPLRENQRVMKYAILK